MALPTSFVYAEGRHQAPNCSEPTPFFSPDSTARAKNARKSYLLNAGGSVGHRLFTFAIVSFGKDWIHCLFSAERKGWGERSTANGLVLDNFGGVGSPNRLCRIPKQRERLKTSRFDSCLATFQLLGGFAGGEEWIANLLF
jgi:hypothetical protein